MDPPRFTVSLLLLLACVPCAGAPWGVAADFANQTPFQSEYEAPVLAASGINCVLLNMRGMDYNWPMWARAERAFTGAKVSCVWDLPTSIGECEHIYGMDQGTLEIGSFFDPALLFHAQRVGQIMLTRLPKASGCRVTPNVDLTGGSSDKDALASWQQFLKTLFADNSPGEDTNSDFATFNAAYGTSFASWDTVPLKTSDTADPRKRQLRDLWVTDSYASFAGNLCASVSAPGRPIGPGVSATGDGAVDVSLLASNKHINRLYVSDADAIPAAESIAAAFGKNLFAAAVPLIPGDYEASRQRAVKLLPYVEGTCFDYRGLVLGRAEPEAGPARRNGPPRTIRRIEQFDSAFRVIPELAPFVGRFHIDRASVLWIVSGESEDILNANCVSEATLVLEPGSVNLSRFKAIIYRVTSPPLSTAILQKLFDYALHGGTVFLEPDRLVSGRTLLGQDPGRFLSTLPNKDGSAVRKIGSGKWVFVNTSQFSTIKHAVKEQAGVDLPDSSRPQAFSGKNCAITIGPATIENTNQGPVCAFDVFSGRAQPVPAGGELKLTDVKPGEARLWVIKPASRPTVLYTDGAIGHPASIADGSYADNTLTFRFAQRAYVSSPDKPTSLTVDGKDVPFVYDPDQHLVTIEREGSPVEARLKY